MADRVRRRAVVSVIGGLILLGCDGSRPSGPTIEEGPVLLWTSPGATHRADHPTTDGDHVFLAGLGGLVVLDARTGDTRWEFDGGFVGFVTPSYAIVDDRVVVSWRGVLRAFRIEDGTELWSQSGIPTAWTGVPGDGYPTDILTSDGTDGVYVSDGERLFRIHPATGEILWATQPAGSGFLSLSAGSKAVCSSRSPVATVACYAEAGGDLLWSVDRIGTSPARFGVDVVGDRAVVEVDGRWIGFDLVTGTEIWRSGRSVPTLGWASTARDGVLYGCDDACVAIRARDGSVLWERPAANLGVPAVADGFLFAVTRDSSSDVRILDASTGEDVDTIEAGSRNAFEEGPAAADGRFFVRTFVDLRGYRYP